MQLRRRESQVQPAEKRRETLRKRAPTPILDEIPTSKCHIEEKPPEKYLTPPDKSLELQDLTVKAPIPQPTAEQKDRNAKRNQSIRPARPLPQVLVDPPPDCAELAGEPVATPHTDGSREPAELEHREPRCFENAADEPCPPCLVPGLKWSGRGGQQTWPQLRSSTWPYDGLSRAGVMESVGSSISFRGADDEDKAANARRVEAGDSSSTTLSETPPTLSPTSQSTPLSSSTNLSTEDGDVVSPLDLAPVRKAVPVTKPMGCVEDGSPSPTIQRGLYSKGSAVSLKQLRARHSLLETRRQTLLQLQRIEQEQEEILEMLASLSDADE
jgi:hypothetical protein